MRRLAPTLILALLMVFGAAPSRAADAVSLSLAPAKVDIGIFYNGATMTVTGTAPADCDVVVRFQGPPEELHMKEKGKVFNLLWMNKATVTFDGAPKAYLVASAHPVRELETPGTGGLALDDLAARIDVTGTDDERSVLVADLVALKGGEGLYAEHADAVAYGAAEDDARGYTATLPLPAKLAPGDYTVEAVALRGGAVVARSSRQTSVQLTGAPKILDDLAFDHGALYGVLATIIALLAGLAVGLVFQSKGAH